VAKIIAKNHQYLGVNSAIESVKNKKELKGKLGVFWHTQGSGKSFSMVFWTQKILRKLSGNWTFLIVTDREDLDGQIYKNFVHCRAVTEKDVGATSRNSLKKLLSEDHRNIFTMIQKFSTENQGETFEELSNRDDIIVIVDEAHRTQYNVLAMNMRKALPNASFIAFTGTPLMTDEKEKTKEVFGDYVSKYGFKESVEDGATVKLYYENRIPELQITNMQLDDDFKKIVEDADLGDESEEKFFKTYVKTYQLITRNDRLETIAKDVVDHFMNRGFMGKAMYIAIDKATAIKMYDKVQKHWKLYIKNLETQLLNCNSNHKKTIEDKIEYMQKTDMAVIVSQAQNEEESIENKGADIKPHRSRMNKDNDLDGKFKDPNNELRIVFVCAMWITGFDAPSVSTLYLDKILKGHTLMQTMARANRVWKDKPDGIIVDYIGIFGALQKALATYGEVGNEDLDGKPIENKEELIKELAKTSLDMETFLKNKGVNLKNLLIEKDKFKKYELAGIVAERVLESEKSKEKFFELVRKLKVLLKAILPDQRADDYLKQILVIVIIAQKIAEISSPRTEEEKYEEKRKIAELSQRVSKLLDNSISIDDYEIKDSKPFDLSQVNFDELKERFSSKDRQKTTLENLKSAVKKKIKELMSLNPTRGTYLDKFEELIAKYNAGDIDAGKLFLELVNFARSLEEEESRHIRENLTEEELVIFDKLTKPEPKLTKKEIEAVKEVAKELLETLKSAKLVVDWKKKQSTRAKVANAIEKVCDKLPEAYDSNIFKNKCDDLYLYFYDNYPSAEYVLRL
jgi:type I restriction enzyme R subunit